ncbi:unnamed protein product [Linum tenue]|uniref:AP2/ERF domain-containing protein n=1 Tax=Linum tenue TaxID=586396 RepID=A0AAV0Q0E6_9ROSI|nr:unnamed protein product [Linum tenue]
MDRAVFGSTQQLHYSQRQSSYDSSSSASNGSGTTSSDNQQHQLAAEVPKKRTGRRVFRETRHPVYRGVRSRKGDKWVCELREPTTGTRVWLGTHATAEMAARAHDVAALAYRGKSACLNFADSAWRLPVPASTDQLDVRRAAAEAAAMFRPADQEDIRRAAAEAAEMFRPGGPATPAEQEEECKDNGDDIDSSNDTNIVLRKVEAEEELEMPRLLSEMAEGPLLSPPPSYGYGGGRGGVEESCDCDANGGYDWTLWNH